MQTLRAVTHFNQTFSHAELILLIQHSLLKQVFLIELSDRRPRKSLCPRRVLIQSDWISSNTLWFPARDKDIDPNEYWYLARHQAKVAVKQSGLRQIPCVLLPKLIARLGDLCIEIFIEDTTGAGKTEAAFILAKRFGGPWETFVERQQRHFKSKDHQRSWGNGCSGIWL